MTHYLFGETTSILEIDRLLPQARARREALEALPAARVVRLLGEAGGKWADAAFPLRRRAEAELPGILGMSRVMVSRSLELLAEALSEEALRARLEAEIGPLEALDRWTPCQRFADPFREAPRIGRYLRARPHGVVLTVAAGNVFLGAAMGLVESLLVKNVSLLKAPSADPLFARLFAESLPGELGRAVAVLSWKGGDEALERRLVEGCDAVVVTGGEEAVRRYRALAPPGIPVIDYGPRLSLAAVAAGDEAPDLPRRLARDLSLWDQQACSSPQVLYVEGRDRALELLERLAEEMERMARELPPRQLTFDEAAEITRERETARFAAAFRPVRLWTSAERPGAWTLILEEEPELRPSPLNRTLLVKAVERLEEVTPYLQPWRGSLQTIGLEAPLPRARALAEAWTAAGATRVCRVGEMAGGAEGGPHDGRWGLSALVRWVALSAEAPRGIAEDWETLHPEEAERLQRQAALELVRFARERSPFYREHLPPAETWEAFRELPLLERETLQSRFRDLLTGPMQGAVVLRSGGTSGEPCYTLLSPRDYEADVDAAVKMFRAAGVRPGDRCANLLLAGDLYGSFLSIHRVLEKLGVLNFPLTASIAPEALARYAERFGINVVVGVSSLLCSFFRELDARGIHPRVETVIFGGEVLPEADRAFLRERFGVRRLASVVGANDGGPIGYQCEHCPGTVHHLASDHVLLEILEGEMVITALHRRLMPLVRYRLGDRGRWVAGRCPCGRTTARFELLGRADDVLCIASTNTAWRDVSAALEGWPGLTGAVQLVGEKAQGRDRIRVRVEGEPAEDTGSLRRHLLETVPGLARRLREGLLGDLVVEVVKPGALPRNPATGKLRRVVDRRLEEAE